MRKNKKNYIPNKYINVGGLLVALLDRWYFLLMMTVLCALVAAELSTVKFYPTYSITAEVSVEEFDPSIFFRIFNRDNLIDHVIERLDLPYTSAEVQIGLKQRYDEENHVIIITANFPTPKLAADIANTVAEYGMRNLRKYYYRSFPKLLTKAVVSSAVRVEKDPRVYIVLGAVIGFLISCYIVFFNIILNNKIHYPEQIADISGYPTFAVIPEETKRKTSVCRRNHAIRRMCVELQQKYFRKIVAFIGLRDNIGTYNVALMCARELAKQGKKVILMEMNIGSHDQTESWKKPPLQSNGGVCFFDYLEGNVDENKVVYQTEVQNMYFVPFGNNRVCYSDAVSKKVKSFISSLSGKYDFTIIVCYDVNLDSDQLSILKCVSAGIIRVKYNGTTYFELVNAINKLARYDIGVEIIIDDAKPKGLLEKKCYFKKYCSFLQSPS
jgi:capsular polysaccharide biosynthesis protein